MGLITFIKTVRAVNKANDFIKEHEATVNNVKTLASKVQEGISFLERHRDGITAMINKAKETLEKLKGIIHK